MKCLELSHFRGACNYEKKVSENIKSNLQRLLKHALTT